MSHRHLLTLLGSVLIAIGILERGWLLLVVWLGGDFLVLGIAHARGAHRILGKRSDGSLPVWSWTVFLPLLLYTGAVWHILRMISREPAHNSVTDSLVVGRRLLPGELDGEFANYIDLTAEFSEPTAIRASAAYLSFPILDGSSPDSITLREFVSRLRPGRTFIHCAQGHGRTGLLALAVMLKSGAAKSVREGMEKLTAVRPGINLTTIQRRCIEKFAAEINEQLNAWQTPSKLYCGRSIKSAPCDRKLIGKIPLRPSAHCPIAGLILACGSTKAVVLGCTVMSVSLPSRQHGQATKIAGMTKKALQNLQEKGCNEKFSVTVKIPDEVVEQWKEGEKE